jgi:hypothetical protein
MAPATRRGVIVCSRLADGPWNLGTSGCLSDFGVTEFVTVGSVVWIGLIGLIPDTVG